MYQKAKNSWIKHIDFVILDILCLQVSFFLAYLVRHRNLNLYSNSVYGNLAIVLILIDVCMMFFLNTCKNVLKRGLLIELAATMRQVSLVILFAVFYLFFVKDAGDFSRITLFLTAIFYAIISYGTRILWKRHVLRNLRLGRKNSIVILTDWANLPQVREDIQHHSYELFQIRGIAVIDVNEKKTLPEKLGDIPFVAEGESVMDYLCHAWVDEVFIDLQPNDPRVDRWIDQLTEMGVTVHLKLANRMDLAANKQFVENLGRYTVLTTSIRTVSTWELFLKRLMDILGGIVGCILTGILFLILAPMIYHESPGPIFFGQTRVGKNGKKFTCYKFRSMYLDAEERKAALAAENRVSDGMMFKLDFDPRIIGSRRLPDGTIKKGLGNKIRDWSIDEFPQFWNVLKGDMSLVGTRPPTEDEWVKYELHHRSRLAIKPGITGMWQVSGRSEITDFEQVVALDRSYIANWSLGLDVKILCKTVGVVLRHEGAPVPDRLGHLPRLGNDVRGHAGGQAAVQLPGLHPEPRRLRYERCVAGYCPRRHRLRRLRCADGRVPELHQNDRRRRAGAVRLLYRAVRKDGPQGHCGHGR